MSRYGVQYTTITHSDPNCIPNRRSLACAPPLIRMTDFHGEGSRYIYISEKKSLKRSMSGFNHKMSVLMKRNSTSIQKDLIDLSSLVAKVLGNASEAPSEALTPRERCHSRQPKAW